MSITDFMGDQIIWEPFMHKTKAGENEYGPPQTLLCRVEQKTRMVWGPQGQTFLPTTKVYFPVPQPAITENDRVTLPNGQRPQIREVRQFKSIQGLHHTTLDLH